MRMIPKGTNLVILLRFCLMYNIRIKELIDSSGNVRLMKEGNENGRLL